MRVVVVFEIEELDFVLQGLNSFGNDTEQLSNKIRKARNEQIDRYRREKDPTLCDYCHEKPKSHKSDDFRYCDGCQNWLDVQ